MIDISASQMAANLEAKQLGLSVESRAVMLDLGVEELLEFERRAEMFGFRAWDD